MISKEKIQKLAQERLDEIDAFLVELSVSDNNHIVVEIDADKGVSIDDCVRVSRNIEHNLDREQEDFQLTVTSAGLDKPFKVLKQYKKNIGKEVEVTPLEGKPLKGILKNVTENDVIIETTEKVKLEGKKKKETITKEIVLPFDKIKKTKLIIKFN